MQSQSFMTHHEIDGIEIFDALNAKISFFVAAIKFNLSPFKAAF